MSIQTPPRKSYDKKPHIGTTSTQILKAPHGSLYICATKSEIGYTERLAKHLKRGDLIINSANWFFGLHKWRGFHGVVVVDHFVYEKCSSRIIDEIGDFNKWKNVKKGDL